jgi:hypothetical protein
MRPGDLPMQEYWAWRSQRTKPDEDVLGGWIPNRRVHDPNPPGEPEITVGEVPLTPGDLAGAGMFVKRIGEMAPRAFNFVRSLFTDPSFSRVISKSMPNARLEGGALLYSEDEIPKLVEMFENMGAPKGLNTTEDFLPAGTKRWGRTTLHSRSLGPVRTQEQDATEAARRAVFAHLPIRLTGSSNTSPIISLMDIPRSPGMPRRVLPTPGVRPRFYTPGQIDPADPKVSEEFMRLLRELTPEDILRHEQSYLDDLRRRGATE